MSLKRYCQNRRIIVLNSDASAYEAVRALEANHIGAAMVLEEGRLVGIVTDRDLALRVIGFDLSPKETRLKDVMTPGPAAVSVEDSEELVAKLMRARHVRRIPILEAERVAGIVTLDDLILSAAVDRALLGEIIEAQLAEPAAAKPAGDLHPMRGESASSSTRAERGAARAAQTLREFKSRLAGVLGVEDEERAIAAFEVVASGLTRRLTPTEANDFAAQFPSTLREGLLDQPAGPDREVTRESIEAEMAERLQLDRESAAAMVRQVGAALGDFVSPSELEHVADQLPRPMKGIVNQHP